jgi:LPXTG-motif cell wall-anchored protein
VWVRPLVSVEFSPHFDRQQENSSKPPPAPAPKAELPKSGGGSAASLFALGAGMLLVGGSLMVRRIIK